MDAAGGIFAPAGGELVLTALSPQTQRAQKVPVENEFKFFSSLETLVPLGFVAVGPLSLARAQALRLHPRVVVVVSLGGVRRT